MAETMARRPAAPSPIRCSSSPSATIWPTDRRGLRLPNGSWKTICISRRSGPQLAPGEALQRPAGEVDAALARQQAQHGQAQRGLAGAALADHAHGLAGAHRERDAVHRLDVADRALEQAALDREVDLEVLGREHHRRARVGRRRRAARLGRQQMAGVGVARAVEDLGHRPLLDQLAPGHHRDPLGEAAHDGEVVRDQQDRHAEPRLQLLQQLQDLRLDGDVEGGGRLVGDQDVGLVRQRHGDHHALPLAARELVRVGAEPRLGVGDLHQPQQLDACARAPRPGRGRDGRTAPR